MEGGEGGVLTSGFFPISCNPTLFLIGDNYLPQVESVLPVIVPGE